MNKVYILGLPASGKTTTAKWLATELNWGLIDLDDAIEDQEGMTIATIFNKKGETYFRNLENSVLRKTAEMNNTVISTGGGIVEFPENIDWMNNHGLTIYLNADKELILSRIIEKIDERPMFMGLDSQGIREKLDEILLKRNKMYSKSKLLWNADNPNINLQNAVNQLIAIYSM